MINLPPRVEDVDQELIDSVKSDFLREYEKEPELYDNRDIERIRKNDWYVKRHLLYRKSDPKKALELLKENMQWRKSFGVWDIKASDFPREFFQSGVYHRGSPDKGDRIMFYNRGKAYRKVPEYCELIKRFFIYLCEVADEQSTKTGRGVGVVVDCTEATLTNVDLDLLWFIVTSFNHYPRAVSYLWVNNIAWLLIPIYNLVTSWFPDEYKRILYRGYTKDLIELTGDECLPDYLDGPNPTKWQAYPNVCLEVTEFGQKHGYSPKSTQKFQELWLSYCRKEDEVPLDEKDYRETYFEIKKQS